MRHSEIVRAPESQAALCRGFVQLADLLALTLGPSRGLVWHDRGGRAPEALEDAGLIARRVVELPSRSADVGAMTLRHMVWGVRERYGDGAATAAVLARAMVRGATQRVVAGYDPMLMRRGMERAQQAAVAALAAQALPAQGEVVLGRLASGVTGDEQLGTVLGELFDVLGEHAAVTVERFAAPYLERAYLDGGRWEARCPSPYLLPEGQPELVLHEPRVVVVDQDLTDIAQVRSLLEAAVAQGNGPLLVVGREIKGGALATLVLNHRNGALPVGLASLRNIGFVAEELGDIAALCGAQLLDAAAGRSPQRADGAAFGRARKAIITRERLTIVGGGGERAAIHERMAQVRRRLARTARTDSEWERLRLRAACLSGGVGVLKIGAHTRAERELRYDLARKAVRTLELAAEHGVLPGGGVAYLHAQTAAQAVAAECCDPDEAAGAAVVAGALDAPFRQIVVNAFGGTRTPSVALDEVRRRAPGWGLDALSGEYVCMAEAGVLDCAAVVRGALEAATSAAIMTVTTDVVVLASARRREKRVDP
jgi:chaperonin GroEL